MLYLVRIDNSHLKIGYTKNLINRMKGLQTGSLNIELIASRDGERREERELHMLCESYKFRNELFKDDPYVISIFKNHIFNIDMIKMKKLEKLYLKQTIENRKLSFENSKTKDLYLDYKSKYESSKSAYKELRENINDIENKIEELSNNVQIQIKPETMRISLDEIISTQNWFEYDKVFPHKGEDSVLIKYSNNIIDIGNGKLFYDIKNKMILNIYFKQANSYPLNNKKTKYYYYDTETSIKYEDILFIINQVNDLFIK